MKDRGGSESFGRGRLPARAVAAALLLAVTSADAGALGNCYFKPVPPVVLKNMGPCGFDPERLSFAGDPVRQAMCLLTPVERVGRLGPPLQELPPVLAERVGRSFEPAQRERFQALLRTAANGAGLGDALAQPVARANDNDPAARAATYLMIHDTSTPNYGARPWPRDIDSDPKINDLNRYRCANKIERAHVFINRRGEILLAHDFGVPWRASKFEMATNFGTALKGLFLHVELIQPRRRDPRYGRRNDFLAPQPGFTRAQYDALALVYAAASARAGQWLIPAFHSVVDEGIRDKHDDPQNFELAAFAESLGKLLDRFDKSD